MNGAHIDLEINGHSVTLLDPGSAPDQFRWVEADAYLIQHSGDAELVFDRYDVRHLMNAAELEQFDTYADQARDPDTYLNEDDDNIVSGCQLDELQHERYIDLIISIEDDDCRKQEQKQEPPTRPFIHPSRVGTMMRTAPEAATSSFRPSFEVPNHIRLPPTAAEHALIEKTAMFVREKGAQPELILKVRQAQNPKFAFLQRDHSLQEYYEFLKHTGLQHHEPDPIQAQIADLKQRLNPLSTSASVAVPDRRTCRVMKLLVQYVLHFGIWFEVTVHERQRAGDRLDFLQPIHRHHHFFQLMKQKALKAFVAYTRQNRNHPVPLPSSLLPMADAQFQESERLVSKSSPLSSTSSSSPSSSPLSSSSDSCPSSSSTESTSERHRRRRRRYRHRSCRRSPSRSSSSNRRKRRRHYGSYRSHP